MVAVPALTEVPTLATLWPVAVIAAALVTVALAEVARPDRPAARRRWPVNFALGLVNALLVRLARVAAPVGVAVMAASADYGLLRQVDLPLPAVIIIAIIVMDFAIYWQHRLFHMTRWGWALHRLHHADGALDVSTAVRFNPAEALVSMLYKSALTLFLGLPWHAVLAFEAWLAVGSIIEHANLRLPPRADAVLRRIWVTPAMHRVHHSAHGNDHNHNYGFALSVWDHLFGTYRAQPSGQQIGLPLGRAAG
jgi:sterol desaturase/sphingolipid hydroxylase (fatty acid hydroxylase superfamily)